MMMKGVLTTWLVGATATAKVRKLRDGSYKVTVPGCTGFYVLCGFEKDIQTDLCEALESWLFHKLRSGATDIPVCGGVDLTNCGVVLPAMIELRPETEKALKVLTSRKDLSGLANRLLLDAIVAKIRTNGHQLIEDGISEAYDLIDNNVPKDQQRACCQSVQNLIDYAYGLGAITKEEQANYECDLYEGPEKNF